MLLEWGGIMLIDVSDLKRAMGREERHAFDLALDPVELGAERVEFPRPAKVALRLLNVGDAILATVDVAAGALMHCARCLEPFDLPLHVEYQEEYCAGHGPAPAAGAPAAASPQDRDTLTSYYYGDAIDFAPGVREQIILALPMKPVCRDDCRGLCPRCGQNLNRGPCACPPGGGDPRLAALGDLWGKPQGGGDGGDARDGRGGRGGRAGEEDD